MESKNHQRIDINSLDQLNISFDNIKHNNTQNDSIITNMSVQIIDEHQLELMIKVFQGYQETLSFSFLENKSQTQIQEQQPPSLQNQLREACIYISNKEAFSRQIVAKALEIFENIKSVMISKSQKIHSLQTKVQQLEDSVNGLHNSVKVLQEQNENSDSSIHGLRNRIMELERGLEENQKDMNNDKDTIQESIDAYSQLSQASNLREKSLIDQNQKINIFLREQKQENNKLKQQILNQKEQIHELDSKIKQYDQKMNFLQNQKQNLKTKIQEMQALIKNIQQEYRQKTRGNSSNRKYSQRQEYNVSQKDQSMILDMRNLNDEFKETEIVFEQEDVFTYTNNLIQKANSLHYLGEVKQKSQNQQKSKQKQKKPNNQQTINRMMIDPYYAHFILTSQSVKIRLDHDQFLGIDFQKYYSQVMENGIQMHNWPSWIQIKLRELAPAH